MNTSVLAVFHPHFRRGTRQVTVWKDRKGLSGLTIEPGASRGGQITIFPRTLTCRTALCKTAGRQMEENNGICRGAHNRTITVT